MELVKVGDASRPNAHKELTLSRDELIEMKFVSKILNNNLYVYFALLHDYGSPVVENLDTRGFCSRWEIEMCDLMSAIAWLAKKKQLSFRPRQLTLELFDE